MKVSKPTWLSRMLGLLNWDIFTWKVYIGDAVENAIDWALKWVNWGISQAERAYDKAVDAWYKALEVYRELQSLINTYIARAYDYIDATKSYLRELINDVKAIANKVDTAWDNFRHDTLPKLLDTQWVRDFFGRGISNISEWWAARRGEIDSRLDAEIDPVREEVNKHSSWLDLIKDLFTDPEKWLLDRIESMIARFW